MRVYQYCSNPEYHIHMIDLIKENFIMVNLLMYLTQDYLMIIHVKHFLDKIVELIISSLFNGLMII